MIHTIKKHTISFKHAFDGIVWAFNTQPNFKIHVIVSFFVILTGFFFTISLSEWIILTLTITIGLVIEMINTGFEETTDAIDLKIREDIKIAKDVAAGAMLTYAIGASIVAGLIFIPKILELFRTTGL